MSIRIVFEPTGYHFLNVGDVAMWQIAVRRLRELWPDALVQVIADDPELLARYLPGTLLVPAEGQRRWLYRGVSGREPRGLPDWPRRTLARVEERARVRASRPLLTATRAAQRARGGDVDAIEAYLAAIEHADALVVSGGGSITDAFAASAQVVLREVELATRRATPTVMFGQGIGPIVDTDLRRTAARVLPQVDAINVREARTSPGLLTSLGVDPSRICVTGDDALELAHGMPPAQGDALGVNVRVAGYSPLSGTAAAQLGRTILAAAADCAARLVAVPISRHPGESDLETVRGMFREIEGTDAETAEDAVAAAARCRVVVTGSYHAGVFALGQGIPCVCLVTSPFYRDKFLGLAGQFPGGCSVVDLAGPDVSARLSASIGAAWERADDVRDDLRAAAGRQVEASRAAYVQARDLIEQRRR